MDKSFRGELILAAQHLRRLRILNRRHYSVSSPLSLYHIDGHHKLIRFELSMVELAFINNLVP